MSGLKIARLFGIDVKIHFTWLIIAGILVYSLATQAFPAWHPEWSAAWTWTLATLTALLFFLSLLAHEFAHSLVGKAQGMEIESITLFVFGGVANLTEEPETPGKEFWMTVAGPAMSFALGAVALFIAIETGFPLFAHDFDREIMNASAFSTMLAWLGAVNLFLGLFNLLPAYPMDGGRILHAAIWKGTGNQLKATRLSSYTGRLFAGVLIGSGALMIAGFTVPFFGEGVGSGIWMIFIGTFVMIAAQGTYRHQMATSHLSQFTVRQIMRTNLPSVHPSNSLIEKASSSYLSAGVPALVTNIRGEATGWVESDDMNSAPKNLSALPKVDIDEPLDSAWTKTQGSPLAVVVDEGESAGYLLAVDLYWLVGHLQKTPT